MGNPITIAQDKLAQYLIDKYFLEDCLVTLRVFKDNLTPPLVTVSYSDAKERTDTGLFITDLIDNFDLTLDGVMKLAEQ